MKSIEYIVRLKQRFVFAPYFGHFIKWKTALWPRFPIFPNFSKIKIRWNLLIWFLEIGHLRVSLGKIWAICQMGRWPVFLDPNSQPFLTSPFNRNGKKITVSRKKAKKLTVSRKKPKILTVDRKNHYPIEILSKRPAAGHGLK